MEISKILVEILNNPNAPKFYRELQKFYESLNMSNESQAFAKLLEVKFNKDVTNN